MEIHADWKAFLSAHPKAAPQPAATITPDTAPAALSAAADANVTAPIGALDTAPAEPTAPDWPVWFYTAKAARSFDSALLGKLAYLVSGRETAGLPEDLLKSAARQCLRIPLIAEAPPSEPFGGRGRRGLSSAAAEPL